jgi:hypothetical protein
MLVTPLDQALAEPVEQLMKRGDRSFEPEPHPITGSTRSCSPPHVRSC